MKIHFIGIGGASLSKLAIIYKSLGYNVSGSDRTQSYTTDELSALGITIFFSHKKENIKNCEMVIYSDAIDSNNEEIIEAAKCGIPLVSRKEALNLIANMYNNVIAICGCHGKTTTTALLSTALNKLCPQTHIGGEINNLALTNKYFKQVIKASKNKRLFITEACEFKKNLLALNPNFIIMLNIDADHLDCYKDINDIKQTFLNFAKKLEGKQESVLFCNFDDKLVKEVANQTKTKIISFGLNDNADYTAKNIVLNDKGITLDLYYKAKKIRTIKSKLYGRHNAYNILASAVVCEYFKKLHPLKLINYSNNIKNFTGVKRRFDILGKSNTNIIIHDYAHHPTEISASIKSCREHFKKPVIVAFEPHTYTRTQGLWKEFIASLSEADKTYLLDIYSARENPIEGITSQKLAQEIQSCEYIESYEKCIEALKNHKDSILLILGAGSIENLAYSLIKNN